MLCVGHVLELLFVNNSPFLTWYETMHIVIHRVWKTQKYNVTTCMACHMCDNKTPRFIIATTTEATAHKGSHKKQLKRSRNHVLKYNT